MSHHAPIPDGRLVDNIVHFARALRKAGVKVGTAQVENAIRAMAAAGFSHRSDFYHTLRATMITRSDHRAVFHQVFALFWRDPDFLASMMHALSPLLADDTPPPPPGAAQRRAEDALGRAGRPDDAPPREEIEQQALLTWSVTEVFRRKDFDQMSSDELAEAARAIRALDLPVRPIRTRRSRPAPAGRPDQRATLRAAMRRGGEVQRLSRKAPVTRPPALVVLCDISGSMSVYSRMVLRYLHALAHDPAAPVGAVHAFTFGTGLTNVTRALRLGDPDAALSAIGHQATDWEGGTRIGAALERFNKDWARRVLGGGAVVLLITDGLERGDTALLSANARRLALSARSVIWLNPLLRYDGFEPRAQGIQTLLRHVDSLHACHSLDSLQALSQALGEPDLRDRYRRQAAEG